MVDVVDDNALSSREERFKSLLLSIPEEAARAGFDCFLFLFHYTIRNTMERMRSRRPRRRRVLRLRDG